MTFIEFAINFLPNKTNLSLFFLQKVTLLQLTCIKNLKCHFCGFGVSCHALTHVAVQERKNFS